jgi:hypothetical protein
MENKRRVLVGKVDLDTIAAAFILGVCPDDAIELAPSQAIAEDLANPEVICIEVGGSGQTERRNFDHHQAGGPQHSATLQAWRFLLKSPEMVADDLGKRQEKARAMFLRRGEALLKGSNKEKWFFGLPPEHAYREMPAALLSETEFEDKKRYDRDFACQDPNIAVPALVCSLGFDNWMVALVKYVDTLEIQGPAYLKSKIGDTPFPTLSGIISGMLLSEQNPVQQLQQGLLILNLAMHKELNPFGTVPLAYFPQFRTFAEIKAKHQQQIQTGVLDLAVWDVTRNGRRFAYVTSSHIGAPGALYHEGAEIVVVFNGHFGPNAIGKFTVAGNGMRVDPALATLQALESGWGGPAHGTIICSPREGAKLTLEQVVDVIKRTL